jgi:23S rRNA (pseudouridine1915-N3)-methyltransferase
LRQGTKSSPEAELFARYASRLRPALALTEIPEASGPPQEAKRRENNALRAAIPSNAHAVALDLGAPALDSKAFAVALARWQALQAPLCFLIGGAEGLDEATLAQVSATLSLGPMTWPHMLARVMLVEQLYRAQTIMIGHPYHRSGRPGITLDKS